MIRDFASQVDPQAVTLAQERLDAHVREIVRWHFDPATGCPFWLERAREFDFDPLTDVKSYRDLDKFGPFEDEWLRGGPVRRWVPKAYADKPIYVFETGGSTGVPKSRIAHEDFRIDYSNFSETLPGRRVSEGVGLADGRTERPAPAAARDRAPRAASRRHLLHGRSRSALGDQADQEPADGSDGGLQAARHRSGADAAAARTTTSSACSPRRSCSRRSARRCRSRRWASAACSAAAPR